MEVDVGDLILYRIKNFTECTFLILDVLGQLDFGTKILVLELDTGKTYDFVLYPIDKMYVTKVA